MSEYLKTLIETLGDKCKIEPDGFKLKVLSGEQTWFKVLTDDVKSFIFSLCNENPLPAVILMGRDKNIRILDLGDEYKALSTNGEITRDKKPCWLKYPNGSIVFANYQIFGKLEFDFESFKPNFAYDIIDTCEIYGIDLVVWVSGVNFYATGQVYLELFLGSLSFVRKGLYWRHKIPENNNKITISSLIPFLKLNLLIAQTLKVEMRVAGVFANRLALLNYYESNALPRIFACKLETEYKPQGKITSFEAGIRQIYNLLLNNDKFVKKAEEENLMGIIKDFRI